MITGFVAGTVIYAVTTAEHKALTLTVLLMLWMVVL